MKKSSRVLSLAFVGFALLLEIDFSAAQSRAASKSVTRKSAILWAPVELKWTDIPNVTGAKQAILWGDPNTRAHGVFVKFPAGTEVPLHTHSHEGRGVVISGILVIALEGQTPKELGPGSYFFVPAAVKHKTTCKSGADHCLFLDQSPGAFDIKIVEATATKK